MCCLNGIVFRLALESLSVKGLLVHFVVQFNVNIVEAEEFLCLVPF